ncbi:methylated-DNA--[protein]-cysteine S-methyltransferase [Spiroplasma endosymbiont of Agriotes lineatus]|uniref:methylated-DNA--[protein]-cysteine S-methyltransferase n=1 Tax=Spiroplasma endosymbiont of Agriotes lineatus TaxID=3077930 RepID=UPI0030D13BC4
MKQGYYQNPVGSVMVISQNNKIINIVFILACPLSSSLSKEIKQCLQEIAQYFIKQRKIFSFDYVLNTTKFSQKVLEAIKQIHYDETRTYSDIAKMINHLLAVWAAGPALKINLLAISIPCHRVINKNSKRINYLYGIEIKLALLAREDVI